MHLCADFLFCLLLCVVLYVMHVQNNVCSILALRQASGVLPSYLYLFAYGFSTRQYLLEANSALSMFN